MKTLVFAFLCLIGSVSTNLFAQQSTFLTQVNSAWSGKNYNQIQSLASANAGVEENKLEALAVLFGYRLMISADYNGAVQALDDLASELPPSKADAAQAVNDYKAELIQQSSGPLTPLSSTQLDELHRLFPSEFPIGPLLAILNR